MHCDCLIATNNKNALGHASPLVHAMIAPLQQSLSILRTPCNIPTQARVSRRVIVRALHTQAALLLSCCNTGTVCYLSWLQLDMGQIFQLIDSFIPKTGLPSCVN
eukprot:gnl/MRDRNA2_/MRDRNA2_60656_c0_seq1.p1 gnl/MRDRNA2_/MRDRNA2_60656_c0~~gnl/MRDRNA2_/MRDRNA2_60656_c0_seq1.p1  ORF type:complete len:105 (-),score=9.45 gnl/MRDRNA2_/MRDRNA2_60656_c0_seq1:1031-1345(-)